MNLSLILSRWNTGGICAYAPGLAEKLIRIPGTTWEKWLQPGTTGQYTSQYLVCPWLYGLVRSGDSVALDWLSNDISRADFSDDGVVRQALKQTFISFLRHAGHASSAVGQVKIASDSVAWCDIDVVDARSPHRVRLYSLRKGWVINIAKTASASGLLAREVKARQTPIATEGVIPQLTDQDPVRGWYQEQCVATRSIRYSTLDRHRWEEALHHMENYYQSAGISFVTGYQLLEPLVSSSPLLSSAERDAVQRRLDTSRVALQHYRIPFGCVHGDLHRTNIRVDQSKDRVLILDWEYSRPAILAADLFCLLYGLTNYGGLRGIALKTVIEGAEQAIPKIGSMIGTWMGRVGIEASSPWQRFVLLIGSALERHAFYATSGHFATKVVEQERTRLRSMIRPLLELDLSWS